MTFKEKISKIPIGLTGLAVGIGGLGNAWTLVLQERNIDWSNGELDTSIYTNIIQIFLFIFTILFFFIIVTRQILNRTIFRNEVKDPMLSSFLPTIAMAMMLIGGFIAQTSTMGTNLKSSEVINALTIIGSIFWYCAVTLHITFMVLFFVHVIKNHDFKNHDVYASWFVPPIGIIVSCTVAGSFPKEIIPSILFQVIWCFGFAMYVISLPYVLYKIIFADNIHHDRIPTLAIFGAPANLSLAGFISIPDLKNYWGNDAYWVIIIILTIIALSTTLFLYVCFFRIFRTKFNPTYASLTFPTAIGSLSMLKVSSVISTISTNSGGGVLLSHTFNVIGYIELTIATFINLYVLTRYVILIFKAFIPIKK